MEHQKASFEELVKEMERLFPKELQIAMLTVFNRKLAQKVSDLENPPIEETEQKA